MSVSLADVAAALQSILSPLVDTSSITAYFPDNATAQIALLIVPFGQSGTMYFSRVGPYSVSHAHRIPCQFWVKSDLNQRDAGLARARDIVLSAMILIARTPELNVAGAKVGTWELGNQGQIGQYEIRPLFEDQNQVSWVVATLYVSVQIDELV